MWLESVEVFLQSPRKRQHAVVRAPPVGSWFIVIGGDTTPGDLLQSEHGPENRK